MKIELISGDFQVACDASARRAIAARTTARSQSPLGRLWLEIAAPMRCQATSLPAVEAGYRNKTRLRSLWTTVLVLFRGLFKTPPRRDQKLAPRLSVIFTPTGPLVYRPGIAAAGCATPDSMKHGSNRSVVRTQWSSGSVGGCALRYSAHCPFEMGNFDVGPR